MKDIFLKDKIIPSSSITSVEVVKNPINNLFSLVVRQGVCPVTLLSHKDVDVVNGVFEKIKSQLDGIVLDDLVEDSNKEQEQPKPKSIQRQRQRKPKVLNTTQDTTD